MEEEAKHGKKSSVLWWVIGGIFVVIIAVVVFLVLRMQGTVSSGGAFPDAESVQSLTCTNDSAVLSLINTKNATSVSTKMIATFSKNKLDNISMNYSLKYSSKEDIKDSENINYAAINLSSQKEGLGPDIFNLRFNKLEDSLEIRMYAESEKIGAVSAKYLMLEQAAGSYSESSIKKNYTSQGFKCVSNNK